MKKILLIAAVIIVIAAAVILSRPITPTSQTIEKKVENLRLN